MDRLFLIIQSRLHAFKSARIAFQGLRTGSWLNGSPPDQSTSGSLPDGAGVLSLSLFCAARYSLCGRWPGGLHWIPRVFVSVRRLAQLQSLLVTKRSSPLAVSRRPQAIGFGLPVVGSSGVTNGTGSRVSGLPASLLQLEPRATEVFMVMAVFHSW